MWFYIFPVVRSGLAKPNEAPIVIFLFKADSVFVYTTATVPKKEDAIGKPAKTTLAKRDREKAKQMKQREKEARRVQRKAEKSERRPHAESEVHERQPVQEVHPGLSAARRASLGDEADVKHLWRQRDYRQKAAAR